MPPFDLAPDFLVGIEPPASQAPARYRIAAPVPADLAERRRVRRRLGRALEADALKLQFVPRHALADGAWLGAEARLHVPRSGPACAPVLPPVGPRSRLGPRLACRVIEAACRAALDWPEHWVVAANLPPQALLEEGLAGQVAEALAASGLAPERLELEMAEPVLLDDSVETVLVLSALRDLGVGLTVKEFGARHGCLAALRRLPLTGMRLDARLVRGLPGRADLGAVVRGAVLTGLALGLVVSAEGVASEAQRSFLAALGCLSGQGPYFGPPLAATDVAPCLNAA